MLLSRFTPLGLLELSGDDPPIAERIYDDLVAGLGDQVTLEEGSHLEGVLYALAIEAALANVEMRRAQAQRYAEEVSHQLPQREREYGLVPGTEDTTTDRRTALAARKLRPVTWTRAEIEAGLRTLLGSAFIAYRVPTAAEAVRYPTNLGDQPMHLVPENVSRKILRLESAVSFTGIPQTVSYSLVGAPPGVTMQQGITPTVGDKFIVNPAHSSLAESITVTKVFPEELPPALTATFVRPHAAGELLFTHCVPWWVSWRRHVLVVVTEAAAQDPEVRRKADDFMRRVVRSTTTWDIVYGTPTSTVPFQLDLASLGFKTLGIVNIP